MAAVCLYYYVMYWCKVVLFTHILDLFSIFSYVKVIMDVHNLSASSSVSVVSPSKARKKLSQPSKWKQPSMCLKCLYTDVLAFLVFYVIFCINFKCICLFPFHVKFSFKCAIFPRGLIIFVLFIITIIFIIYWHNNPMVSIFLRFFVSGSNLTMSSCFSFISSNLLMIQFQSRQSPYFSFKDSNLQILNVNNFI